MKPGTFVMGSPPNEPDRSRFGEEQWDVTLTHPVLFGQHEVTQAEWAAMGLPAVSARHTVSGFTNCSSANCAADEINWCMAVEYLNRRSRAEGLQECIVLKKCHGTMGTTTSATTTIRRRPRTTTASGIDCLRQLSGSKAIPNLDPRGTAPASYATSTPYALRLAIARTLSSNNLEAAGDSGQGLRAVRTLTAAQTARW